MLITLCWRLFGMITQGIDEGIGRYNMDQMIKEKFYQNTPSRPPSLRQVEFWMAINRTFANFVWRRDNFLPLLFWTWRIGLQLLSMSRIAREQPQLFFQTSPFATQGDHRNPGGWVSVWDEAPIYITFNVQKISKINSLC